MMALFVCVLILYSFSCSAQPELLRAKHIVHTLSSPEWAGRPANLITASKFNLLLNNELQDFKISPSKFTFEAKGEQMEAINFVVKAKKTSPTILVIAHYDHLGTGEGKSREIGKACTHFGADDNASGVALAILLADTLQKLGLFAANVAIAFTSAHELGLFGSQNLAQSKCWKSGLPATIINLDMVGRLDPRSSTLRVETTSNDPIPDGKAHGLNILREPLQTKGEHSAFESSDRKLTFVTTGIHDDYHRCSDTSDKINYLGILQIRNYLTTLIVADCGWPTIPR